MNYKHKQQKRVYSEEHYHYNIWRNYKLSPEDYQKLLDKQGGVCALCNLPETKVKKKTGTLYRLSIDHCHETGKVRGLLCKDCNLFLGLAKDNVEVIQRAVNYLVKGV